MTAGVTRFSVSVDPALLEEFDETVRKLGHTRSNAIQIAIRDYLTEHSWTLEPQATVVGAISMIYDHDVRGVGEGLMHTQHHFIDVISSTTHVHLDERNCLEIIAFRGAVETIKSLANQLMTTKGIKQLKIATLRP